MKRWAPVLLILATLAPGVLFGINASDRYRSPRNPERKVRATTELIVLHTTEAPAKSSLNKVSDRGECHFVVTEDGSVYRIVDRDKEAFHAGRSMWNGREDCDKFSIGIEVVGYHDKAMGTVQLTALRDLVRELKAMYRLSDEKVVCHSHVAYGAPNKWHRFKHRGRKRCGMLFAMPSVRRFLNLKTRPAYDADVRARRLQNADEYLRRVLYGNVDLFRSVYAKKPGAAEAATEAKQAGIFSWLGFGTSGTKTDSPSATAKPSARTTARKSARPAATQTAPAHTAASAKPPKSVADLKARGYVVKGTISPTATASRIAGRKWNAADTYYTIRNKVIPGNALDPAHIEKGMSVWMKK